MSYFTIDSLGRLYPWSRTPEKFTLPGGSDMEGEACSHGETCPFLQANVPKKVVRIVVFPYCLAMTVVGGDVAKASFKGTIGSGGERARLATLRTMGGRVGSPWLSASPSRSLPPDKLNFSGVRDLSGSALAPGETLCTKERRRPLATARAPNRR